MLKKIFNDSPEDDCLMIHDASCSFGLLSQQWGRWGRFKAKFCLLQLKAISQQPNMNYNLKSFTLEIFSNEFIFFTMIIKILLI